MANKLGVALQNALRDFLAPLEVASLDEARLHDLLDLLGLTQAVSSNPTVRQIIGNAGALSNKVAAFDTAKLDSFQGVQDLLEIGNEAKTVLRQLQSVQDPALASIASGLGEELVALLLASYLRRLHPTLFRVGSLLTLIESRETAAIEPSLVENGSTLRYARVRDQFKFFAIEGLLSHPEQTLKDAYLPNGMATGLDARLGAQQLFPQLAFLAEILGLSWRVDNRSVTPAPLPTPLSDESLELDHFGSEDVSGDAVAPQPVPLPNEFFDKYYSTFTFVLRPPDSNGGAGVSINVLASSLRHPGATAGYILTLTGTLNSTDVLGAWRLALSAKGQVPAFVLGPTGISLAAGSVPVTDGAAHVVVESVPPANSTGPAFILGGANSSRVEVGAFRFATDLFYGPDRKAIEVTADASSAALVIVPGDGDGFLQNVLPKEGMRLDVDLGLLLSSDKGFTFRGSGGLDADLPVTLSLGEIAQVNAVHLGLKTANGALRGTMTCDVQVRLGPIDVSVERLGLAASYALSGDDTAPNLSDFDFSFNPPSGAGLVVDAAGVSGGGFLGHDEAKHEYSGVLQLEFTDLALQAFGLITTQVANGHGYSLLALLDADFPPVQLGWGFTLDGVGGLLAVHRTASVDALRAALKADQLSTILFPKNAITNAPQILAQLDTFFPTAPGRFLFGPMALIGWGTPTMLTAALAVILELPEPVRIILLARLAARLPSESETLVRINMDALGVLDLSQNNLTLDATLFDSRLLSFPLSGDMALRATWAGQREFLLAIGGFHPRFTPPAGFPSLRRMTIDMPSGIVSTLHLETYFAITSNTLQFGADLHVVVSVSIFAIDGHLGFDALFHRDPFHFDADISGSVGLRAAGDDLLSVRLDARLSGPAPWHISGSFKVHVIFDVHKSFHHGWGEDAPAQQIAAVDVGQLLATTFADRHSWGAQLADGTPALVSTRRIENPTVMVAHPLARLEVHERIVPLGLDITRFGSAALAGANHFAITDFRIGGSAVPRESVQDDFAPAEFFDLSDDEKLARPSFERHDAGVRLGGGPDMVKCGSPVPKNITYKTFFVDEPGGEVRPDDPGTPKRPLLLDDLKAVLGTGAAGRSAMMRAGNRRYTAPGNPIRVTEPAFVVVNADTLAPAGIGPASGGVYSDMHALLAQELNRVPTQQRHLQIVATHEMVVPNA